MPGDAPSHFKDLASHRGNTRPGIDAWFRMSQPLFDFVNLAPEVLRHDLKASPAEKTNRNDQEPELIRKLPADRPSRRDRAFR